MVCLDEVYLHGTFLEEIELLKLHCQGSNSSIKLKFESANFRRFAESTLERLPRRTFKKKNLILIFNLPHPPKMQEISFFEFQAEDCMKNLLPSLIHQIISQFGKNLKSNQISWLIYGFLEAYSLRCHSASFSETFYTLKRIPQITSEKLLLVHWTALLAPQIFFQYLPTDPNHCKIKNALRFLLESFNLLFKFTYLFDLSPYYSPIHCLLGIHFERTTGISDQALSWHGKIFRWISLALPFGLFLRRLWQWWITTGAQKYRQMKRQNNDLSVEKIPPPPLFLPASCSVAIVEQGKCSICGNDWKKPMASKTGYIYCKSCITESLQVEQRCPMTGLKLFLKEIRPIYT